MYYEYVKLNRHVIIATLKKRVF